MSAGTGAGEFDVAVVGAGVVGCAIARELAGHRHRHRAGRRPLSVALLDANDDVGEGTSKANTAILHTGFDAAPGTLEARLVRRGHALLTAYARDTGIPVERPGALLVAWTAEEREALPGLRAKAERNGHGRCELIGGAEVHRRLPALRPGALGGLAVPDESIVCGWTTTLALATDALARGARPLLGRRVVGVTWPAEGGCVLGTSRGPVAARWVVNAAGLGADRLDEAFGYRRFTVTPRRGELLVFDKRARPLAPHIVLPVPGRWGKGVLVTPTVYGNVLLGPTAEEVRDRSDTSTTEAGIASLRERGARLMPRLMAEEVTACYAGLRASIGREDYLIEVDEKRRYALVGGIRSTGLSSAMAIAEHVRELLGEAGLALRPRAGLPPPPAMPNLGEAFPRPYRDAEAIGRDPAYGRVVCFCERVTEGEIRDALRSPLPPSGLGGLRRRTRAMNGRCQGFHCAGRVASLLATARPGARAATRPATEAP
ncbi:NAD(P)/FAD-dependent oxidoreductase [Streptomyces sp. 6N223]|uniref:NAD(P)/FAD-dependent oxidoreductase n=1 Tax=Streptomyces sp. 6N223 TaxID=3457412 RepID=UPI003FD20617